MEKLLPLSTTTDFPIFILDSHRPYHLSNIENQRIQLLDDTSDPLDPTTLPLSGFEVTIRRKTKKKPNTLQRRPVPLSPCCPKWDNVLPGGKEKLFVPDGTNLNTAADRSIFRLSVFFRFADVFRSVSGPVWVCGNAIGWGGGGGGGQRGWRG